MTSTGADEFRANTTIGFDTPGEILRTREVMVPHIAGLRRAWQVIYTTKTTFGIPVASSGIVLEPVASSGGAIVETPVVVYCPTFHGLGGRCAPSELLVDGNEPDSSSIAAALVQGWTVAVPDGVGLGIDGAGPHHFLAKKAGARAVLDLARAVVSQPAEGRIEAPVAVWGYADGGRVAAAAAEYQPAYAPELDLRAVAAGAVIRDPGALINNLDGGPWSGFAFAGMVGLARAYSHLPVDHLLTDAGMRAVQRASEADLATLLVEFLPPLAAWCERPDPWNDPVWNHILTRENLGTKTPLVPVHLYHGLLDGLVPIESGRELFAEYTSRDVAVSWSEFDVTHLGAADLGVPDVLTTFRAGFARPPRHQGPNPTN
ncbi:lipase family protein [Nocardia fluminea]|uniref:Secretory lipase n=1 Tax=Nocardia fluminea TaxID=134984 RepID=A0A2N3VHA8_9NOCA|nr:lipase family protein [Nocardia fluminea]PKV81017.1 secretory lipase [Nocardia fluminea]